MPLIFREKAKWQPNFSPNIRCIQFRSNAPEKNGANNSITIRPLSGADTASSIFYILVFINNYTGIFCKISQNNAENCLLALVYLLSLLAYLTQNTRLTRLVTRVNRSYNRTNRVLIRVTLGPVECIIESHAFVNFQKPGTDVMSVYARISDRTRPWENVWDRIYMRPYIHVQPYIKSISRVCTYVFKRSPYDKYGIRTNHTWSRTVRNGLVLVYTVSISTSLFMIYNCLILSPVASAGPYVNTVSVE